MILVVFALPFEAGAFVPQHGVEVWVAGVAGKPCAEALSERMIPPPDLVISAGLAGGLDPDLQAGDLVIAENFTSPQFLPTLQMSGLRCAPMLTRRAVVATRQEKQSLRVETGAALCDMETFHIAEVCARADVPLIALRAVSDDAHTSLPVPKETLVHPITRRPDTPAMMMHLVLHPWKIPGFVRMVRQASLARRSLAEGIGRMVAK